MHIANCTSVTFNSMVTLTYGGYYPSIGKLVKIDLQIMLRHLRRYGENYLWFLEFQRRGAPHFHILLEVDCITPIMRYDLMDKWVRTQTKREYFLGQVETENQMGEITKLVRFNMHHRVWELINRKDGAARYVAKYGAKASQKTVPKHYLDVGRFWGCSRDVTSLDGVRVDATSDEIRKLLREKNHPAGDFEVLPKFVWGLT